MNTTKHPMELDSVIYTEEQQTINPFLVEKLKQISDYVSDVDEDGSFFVNLEDWRIDGKTMQSFICLANVFKYTIQFTVADKAIIYFFKA